MDRSGANPTVSQSPRREKRAQPAAEADDPEAGRRAERILRKLVEIGREHHQYVAADALERYLGRKGDLHLTRKEARGRGGVTEAEARNHSYIERDLLRERTKKPDLDYQKHLRVMEDGATLHLPIKEGKADDKKDYWEAYLGRGIGLDTAVYYLTEYLATGNSHVKSTAENGFVATRKGDTIRIEGIVEHNWSDRYDFAKGSGWTADQALIAEKHGLASPYQLKAAWKQKVAGTVKIVNGQLSEPQFRWEDLE